MTTCSWFFSFLNNCCDVRSGPEYYWSTCDLRSFTESTWRNRIVPSPKMISDVNCLRTSSTRRSMVTKLFYSWNGDCSQSHNATSPDLSHVREALNLVLNGSPKSDPWTSLSFGGGMGVINLGLMLFRLRVRPPGRDRASFFFHCHKE